MTNNQIREIALQCGFKLKEQPNGEMDLNPYVYDFAKKIIRTPVDYLEMKDEWVTMTVEQSAKHENQIFEKYSPVFEEWFKCRYQNVIGDDENPFERDKSLGRIVYKYPDIHGAYQAFVAGILWQTQPPKAE